MVPVSVALLSSDGEESTILQVHAIIMTLTQSSKARVKFRVKVNPEESDYVFDESIYRTYRMLLASPSGSVFAKFDIRLTPVPSILIPKTYSFIDKSTKLCIPYLQCIFRHIDGSEEKGITDENGVLIVPKLNEQGQWNMVTSSLRCESFFETHRRSLLYLPEDTDDDIPNVCISLKSYHHIQGKGVTFDRVSIPPNNHSIPKDLLSAEPKITISPTGGNGASNGNGKGTSGRGSRDNNNKSNGGVTSSVTISLGEVYMMELSKEELHMVAGIIEKGGSTALSAIITQVPVNAQQPHHLQQPQLPQSQSQPSFMMPSTVLLVDAVTTVVPSSDPSTTSHNGLSVKFRVRMNPQTPHEAYNPANYGKWRVFLGSWSGAVFAKFDVTLIPHRSLTAPKRYMFIDKDTELGISNLICVFEHIDGTKKTSLKSNEDGMVLVPELEVEGKWTLSTHSASCDTFFQPYETVLMHCHRRPGDNSNALAKVSLTLQRCFGTGSESVNIPSINTNPFNPELPHKPPIATVYPLSTEGVVCIVDEVYAFDLTKVDLDHIGGEVKRAITDQRSVCGLSAVLSRDGQSSVVWVVEGVAMPANSGVGGATVKFRVRVVVDVQHAEEMFNPNQYGKWSMLMGSPSGSVFAKFPLTLSPNPSILVPHSYLFVDKAFQVGIPSLRCSFRHTNGSEMNTSADVRGVLVVPNLGTDGKWTVETSSEGCEFGCEQFKSELLWMDQHVNIAVPETRVFLYRKLSSINIQPLHPFLVNANNIRHWGSTPPTYLQCGIPVSYDHPMVNIGGELERRMRNNTPSALSVLVLHEADNSPCNNLELLVVAVSRGSGASQFMVKLQANPTDKFNFNTYGKRKVELAGPDGFIFAKFVLEVLPEMPICPPNVYECCDSISENRINVLSTITFKNVNGSESYDFNFNAEVVVPATIPNGVYEVTAKAPGYGDAKLPDKVVFYTGPVARIEQTVISLVADKKEEAILQKKLRMIGRCPQNYNWLKIFYRDEELISIAHCDLGNKSIVFFTACFLHSYFIAVVRHFAHHREMHALYTTTAIL
eukprot:gene12619-26574_t